MKERPEEFRRWLTQAAAEATDLMNVLRMQPVDPAAADKAYRAAAASCVTCHARYRDVP